MPSHDTHRSILVALDPRDADPSVLERATRLALRDEARLTIFIAAGLPSRLIWLVPGLPEDPVESLRREGERRLSALARSCPPDLALTTKARVGAPLATLLHELRDGRHDLVVIGGASRCRWKRALVRRSPAPVLVIAPPERATAPAVGATRQARDLVAAP